MLAIQIRPRKDVGHRQEPAGAASTPPSPKSRQRRAKSAPAILLVLQRLHAHGHHQVVQGNSPPCLAVQVVESILQGLRFGQEFAAAGRRLQRVEAVAGLPPAGLQVGGEDFGEEPRPLRHAGRGDPGREETVPRSAIRRVGSCRVQSCSAVTDAESSRRRVNRVQFIAESPLANQSICGFFVLGVTLPFYK